MRILYKFPSRSRPHKFINCLDNIFINQLHEDFIVLATLDEDDTTMNNPDMIDKMARYDRLKYVFGKSDNKIHAVNRDMDQAGEFDILVVMSDDMLFTEKGFDKIIIDGFRLPYHDRPFDLDQMVHFPDQHQGKNCMTMYIAGRDYYNRDGFIYDPRCKSLWADVISQETAQVRGKYKYVDQTIFHHLHPSFMDCAYDEQYRKTEAWDIREHDYAIYREAKKVYDIDNILPLRNR